MNKLKEQLRLRMLGQLSDERTKEDIDNAYDVAVDFSLSVLSFLRENYYTEFETWTGDKLPKGKVQKKKGYDLVDIEKVSCLFIKNNDN